MSQLYVICKHRHLCGESNCSHAVPHIPVKLIQYEGEWKTCVTIKGQCFEGTLCKEVMYQWGEDISIGEIK